MTALQRKLPYSSDGGASYSPITAAGTRQRHRSGNIKLEFGTGRLVLGDTMSPFVIRWRMIRVLAA